MTNSICNSLNSIVDYNEAAIVSNCFIKLKNVWNVAMYALHTFLASY